MALVNHIAKTESYVGQVLRVFENNGYHDSDFMAHVWDDELQTIKEICYDSTCHAGSGISAKIDASQETLEKVAEWARPLIAENRYLQAISDASRIQKDCLVRVYKGRKVAKGTEGKVFWLDTRKGFAYGTTETILGIALDDVKENGKYKNVVFVNADNCERLDKPQTPTYEEIFSSLGVTADNVMSSLSELYGYRIPKKPNIASVA